MCGEDGFVNYAKYLLCSVNFFIAITGMVLVLLSVSMKTSKDIGPIIQVVPELETGLEYVVALGFVVFVVSMVGCVGAIAKHKYILLAYVGLLGVMVVVKFIIAIMLYVKASKNSSPDLIKTLDKELDENKLRFMGLEGLLKCCGVVGFKSYTDRGTLPSLACCPLSVSSLPGMCTDKEAYPGCASEVWTNLQPVYKFLASCLLILAFLELLILLCTCCLLRAIWDNDSNE